MNYVNCNKIIEATKEGITLECDGERIYIDLKDCAKNFSLEMGKVCTCVATRDIATLSFIFYTQPKTKVVFKRNYFKELIAGKSATNKFLDVQKAIVEVGYTSYDLS